MRASLQIAVPLAAALACAALAAPPAASATPPDNCPPSLDEWVRDQMAAGVQRDADGQIVGNSYVEPADGWLCDELRSGDEVCRRASRLPDALTLDAPRRGGTLGGLRLGMTRAQVCRRWGAPRAAYGDLWWWGADSPTAPEFEMYRRAAGKLELIVSYCRYAVAYLPFEQRPRDVPCRHADRVAAYERGGRLAQLLGPQAPQSARWVAVEFGPRGMRVIVSWRAGDRGPRGVRPGTALADVARRVRGATCVAGGCSATRRSGGAGCRFTASSSPIYDRFLYPDPIGDRGTLVRSLALGADGRGCTAPRRPGGR